MKHRSIQCYRYLLVDCVEKGPVHPLLELPPPIDPIVIPLPLPILLPRNMGLNPDDETDRHDITKILLKVSFNTIKITPLKIET
jgi:hypothetical protein